MKALSTELTMQHTYHKNREVQEIKDYSNPILDNVKADDWSLIASLTYSIKDDSNLISRFTELRSKINAGIYHVDKDLIIDTLLKRII